jgi:hypothetical protein
MLGEKPSMLLLEYEERNDEQVKGMGKCYRRKKRRR